MADKPILVTAAVIQRGELILVAQRKKDSKVEADKWEFPGGKVEYLETPEDSLVREIEEELGLKIRVHEFLTLNSHVYQTTDRPLHVVLLAYLCEWIDGEARNLDVQDSKWMTRDELLKMDWAAADVPVVQKLVSVLKS